MSYDLPVRRSQEIGSAYTVATLPTLQQMVGEPIGMLAYTIDGGLYAWNGTIWVAVAATSAKNNILLYAPVSYYIAPSSIATSIAVTGASWASNVATLTFSAITTALPVGMVITVTGMTPSGYNVSNVQITASTTTSVSFALASNPGAFSSGGTISNGSSYTPTTGAVSCEVSVCGAGGGGGGGVSNNSGGANGGKGGDGFVAIVEYF